MKPSPLVLLLLVLVAGPTFGADPEVLPKELVGAWEKQKHYPHWFGLNPDSGYLSQHFANALFEPGTVLPGFSLETGFDTDKLRALPPPDQPFGVEVHLRKGDGKLLAGLKDLKQLRWLDISGSKAEEDDLAGVAELTHLEVLRLSETQLGDTGLKTVGKLKDLRKLGLKTTRVTDAGLPALKGCDKLEHLELGFTSITDKGAAPLTELKALKYLDVCFTKMGDEGAKTIATMGHLRGLSWNTRLTPAGLKALGRLKDLERLHLDGEVVTAESVAAVAKMTHLTHLRLLVGFADKTPGDDVFRKLEGLKDLRDLCVYGWQITDASLPTLRGFEKLEVLDLKRTNIKRASAEQLQKDLPKCRITLPD